MIKPAFLDLPNVAQYVMLSESTWQELVRKGSAPKPRLISPRRVGWLTREVDEWAEARDVSDLLPPPNSGVGRAGKGVAA